MDEQEINQEVGLLERHRNQRLILILHIITSILVVAVFLLIIILIVTLNNPLYVFHSQYTLQPTIRELTQKPTHEYI